MTTLVYVAARDGSVVIGADSRISAGNGIIQDDFLKIGRIGNIFTAFAGNLGPWLDTYRRWELEEITTLDECAVLRHGAGWTALLFCKESRECRVLDADGAVTVCTGFATVGSGSDTAWGFIRAFPEPKTSKAARVIAVGALRAAQARDSATGSHFELVCISPKGRVRRAQAEA